MTSLRTYLAWFAMACAGMMLVQGAVVWAVDPLGYLRGTSRLAHHISDQRLGHPGIIKGVEFDTLVVGSSMSENVADEMVRPDNPSLVLNLATSAASLKQQAAFVEASLREAEDRGDAVLDVYWELYDHAFLWGARSPEKGNFRPYLYEPVTAINLAHYLFTPEAISYIKLWSEALGEPVTDVDERNKWAHRYSFDQATVIKEICRGTGPGTPYRRDDTLFQGRIEHEVRPIILKHPNTRFHFYAALPSIAYYWSYYKRGGLDLLFSSRSQIIPALEDLPNASFHDPSADVEFIMNLDNYKDANHHIPAGNARVFQLIRRSAPTTRIEERRIQRKIRELVMEMDTKLTGLIATECPNQLPIFGTVARPINQTD